MSAETALPEVDSRTLPAAFDAVLRRCPDRMFLRADDGDYTFTQTHERSLRLAAGLAALGVQAQSPVVLMLDNSADAAMAWLATGLTRVVEVPVNTAYKGDFLAHVVNDSGASVAVVEEAYCARLAAVAGDLAALRAVVVRGGSGAALAGTGLQVLAFEELLRHASVQPEPTRPGDLLAIAYTSGTTGRSKGVRVPHAQAYTYASWQDAGIPGSDARILVTLPLFHLSGQWYGLYQALIAGATCVLRPRFSASGFWADVRRHGVTHTLLLGAMAQMLLSGPPSADDADNPLELAVVVPLPPDLQEFRRRFGTEVATVFGMTECGIPLTATPNRVVPGGAGRPRPGFDVRVVDEHDREVPPDVVGELVVRPEVPWTVMDGYHGLPEQTARTFRNLWLHTGDAFSRNADGEYFFRDRMKDALRRRGENISSFEVESVVNGHPAVAESAVVAVPSTLTEDELKVVVVLEEGCSLDPAELIGFLLPRMPYFAVTRYVEVRAELPKTPTQKVRKAALRADGVLAGTWDREAAGVVVTRTS